MVGWHHRLDGHGFGWTPGVGDGQGGLVSCGSWGHKESDTTERLSTAIKEGDLEEVEDRSLICVIITALGTAERLRN